MTSRAKKFSLILYIIIFSTVFIAGFSTSTLAAYEHDGDQEDDLVNKDLNGAVCTWKVLNASGVFADDDVQPGNMFRYKVEEVNTKEDNEHYKVKIAYQDWGENDFDDYSDSTYDSTYLIAKRHWGEIAINYMLEPSASYWNDLDAVDREYETTYETEWWNWQLMNTATISFLVNDTNYDIAKYSREEGILLERKVLVNVEVEDGEDIKGSLRIVLVDYSGSFILSPWFYIIVIVIIVAMIATVVILLSLLIQKRKNIYREIDEI